MSQRVTRFIRGILAIVLGAWCSGALAQTTFTWTNPNSGALWSDTTSWSGGLVADGIDNTANFNTLDLTANNTVTLDTAPTLGFLIFGDTTPSNDWTIGGTSTLTLATSIAGTTPAINVVNRTTTIQ